MPDNAASSNQTGAGAYAGSGPAGAGASSRKRALPMLLTAVALGVVGGTIGLLLGSAHHPIVVPEAVLLEDFQRPPARTLTEGLMDVENQPIVQLLETEVLKPYFDDVQTALHDVTAIEVMGGALPDRSSLRDTIRACATVLHLTCPRVYVVSDRELNACAGNLTDPVILVNSETLETFTDRAELRFLLGHEMGHIRAGHTKLLAALSAMVKAIRAHAPLPDALAAAPLLALHGWTREAEMSADAAGLICCQDLRAAEQALARLAHGSKKKVVGQVDIGAYLAQGTAREISKSAEMRRYVAELQRDHPFIPERIRALREYSQSRQYLHLFE